jgi:hypothetical protein
LDHFLRLESQVLTKSTSEWDRALELSKTIGYALLRICHFPTHHFYLYAFNKIKYLTIDLPTTLYTQISDMTDYESIEVEEVTNQ